jgi:hypothetical protein
MNLAIESCFMSPSFRFLFGFNAAQQFPRDSRKMAPKFSFGNRLGAEPTHVLGNPRRSLREGIQRLVTHATFPHLEASVDGAVAGIFIGRAPRPAQRFEELVERRAQRRPVLDLRTEAAHKLLHPFWISLLEITWRENLGGESFGSRAQCIRSVIGVVERTAKGLLAPQILQKPSGNGKMLPTPDLNFLLIRCKARDFKAARKAFRKFSGPD